MNNAALISKEIESRYDVSLLAAPVEVVLWAAERLVSVHGEEVARCQLSAANRKRERMGRMPAYPAWGTVLFGQKKGGLGAVSR